jgi:hypothetical protein
MPHPDTPPVRLHARHVLPPFAVPAAAWGAIESLVLSSSARPLPFAERPADAEEATVLGVFLDSVLSDQGREAERTGLLRACPDFFGGQGGAALVAWLEECNGFAVEGGKRRAPPPSAN